MSNVKSLTCMICGKEYSENEVKYTCPHCGPEGILEINYDYNAISKSFDKSILSRSSEYSMWRYLPVLPIKDTSKISPLKVGWTPLYPVERLRRLLDLEQLWIKDDGRNPSGSLKDRASSVVVAKARELGIEAVTCASTGNAASSLACISASLGIKNYIFVPRTAPKAKIAQLLVFGAKVFAVRGTYDEAFDLSIKATERFGWYNRNTAFNPFTVEGKKTVALEIAEQMEFKVPDFVFVSVGDGNIISGVWKGYKDLYELGFTRSMPKLVPVQAEGCSPIVDAINEGTEVKFTTPNTIADSIAVGIPRSRIMAIKYIRESGGFGVKVSDSEILSAIKLLGSFEGIFAEPAGSTAFAGVLRALKENKINRQSKIVAIVTGNGLKDIESAMKVAGTPIEINPDIEEVPRTI